MKPAPFVYHAPRDRSSAVSLLGSLPNAKVLAGGQSLVPMLNMRYAAPDHVIDLNRVAGLAGVRIDEHAVEIGAMTRQVDLLESSELARRLPLVAAALRHVGHVQTRSRGTIGGSLCHLDPAAELPLVALVSDATLTAAGPRGERSIPAAEWARGFMAPALAPDEILVSIRFDLRGASGYGFHEFARRHGDFAIVAAAVLIELDGERVARARAALGGVGPTALRLGALEAALRGQQASRVGEVIGPALAALEPVADAYYGARYRRHLARVLAERAMRDAIGRAREAPR